MDNDHSGYVLPDDLTFIGKKSNKNLKFGLRSMHQKNISKMVNEWVERFRFAEYQ